jgi:hypothetical protein
MGPVHTTSISLPTSFPRLRRRSATCCHLTRTVDISGSSVLQNTYQTVAFANVICVSSARLPSDVVDHACLLTVYNPNGIYMGAAPRARLCAHRTSPIRARW